MSSIQLPLCVSLGFNLQRIIPCLMQPLINLHNYNYNYKHKHKYWHNHRVKKEERKVYLSPAFSIAWLSQTQRSVRFRRDRHALHASPRWLNKCRDDPGVLDFLFVKTSDWWKMLVDALSRWETAPLATGQQIYKLETFMVSQPFEENWSKTCVFPVSNSFQNTLSSRLWFRKPHIDLEPAGRSS